MQPDSVANAIGAQEAFATAALATLLAMTPDEQAWRASRLQDAADRCGGADALGKALGFANGAFVKQMLSGRRAITEKTVRKVEDVRGMAGWFDRSPQAHADAPVAPSALLRGLRREQLAALIAEATALLLAAPAESAAPAAATPKAPMRKPRTRAA